MLLFWVPTVVGVGHPISVFFSGVNAPIGIFDSGLGGLSVLRLLPAAMPGERFVYAADTARAPYGGKPAEQIITYSTELADALLNTQGCRALVIACNTATAAAAEVLRARYPDVPIVGMEPAVKPAAAATTSGVVGVMATAGTIGSERYGELLGRYGREVEVVEDACEGLVELIEAGASGPRLSAKLRAIAAPMLAAGADAIVLGCTHFPLVRAELQAIVGPEVQLIDPAPAVVREVVRRIRAEAPALPSLPGTPTGPHAFLTSGDVVALRQNVTRIVPHLAATARFARLGDAAPPPPALTDNVR